MCILPVPRVDLRWDKGFHEYGLGIGIEDRGWDGKTSDQLNQREKATPENAVLRERD
jgi:hypothetical protein